MRDWKISTKSSSSLWKTLRKSDQRSPKIGALSMTDPPYRRRLPGRFLRLLCQLLRRTNEKKVGWFMTVIFLSPADTKLHFYNDWLCWQNCSTPTVSLANPVNGRTHNGVTRTGSLKRKRGLFAQRQDSQADPTVWALKLKNTHKTVNIANITVPPTYHTTTNSTDR